LKRGVQVDLPSANVDFAPTFLTLLGLPIPSTMQGRVLREAIGGGPSPASMRARATEVRVSAPESGYTLTGTFTTVDSGGKVYRYFDQTVVTRR
jgi:arylsulfatase A-like enzyme